MNQNDIKRQQLLATAPPPHIPAKLPLETFELITPKLLQLLSQAGIAIGQYTGFL